MIDNAAPGVNEQIGLFSQRYFEIRVATQATILATVASTASLKVEILDLENKIVAAGTGSAATATPGGTFVIRVVPASGPVSAPFNLRIQLTP